MQKQCYLNLERIKELMQERGIDEKQLAEQVGVSKRCLHGYLTSHDHKRIPFKIFYGLISALQVKVMDIITETPQKSE